MRICYRLAMPLTTHPLSDRFGLEIRGIDLRHTPDASLITKIVNWLYLHSVICIRSQSLSPAELLRFGECLGQPVEHNEASLRLDGLPGVMSLSNADQRDDRQLNGGAHWHTDLIHTDTPASFTMLNAVAVPEHGGGTVFANQTAALEALDAERRSLARSLTLIHCYEGRTDGSMPTFEYPLVRPHPVTGREALFGASDTGIGIVGMTSEEAAPVLREFECHATRPEFVYLHHYQQHDVVIWDNAQLLHCAERLQRARKSKMKRIMHRVSVRGWPTTNHSEINHPGKSSFA